MNLNKVLRCQANRLVRSIVLFLQKHPKVQLYLFENHKRIYCKLRYVSVFGKRLNFNKAETIHEKLFWLAANWRNPLIAKCADKYRVREYVAECGCADILNQLYGAFDRVEDIDFCQLPDSFVMKSNKGSGDNLFVLDKKALDINEASRLADIWRGNVYGIDTAEFQYHHIPFKILCERYLKESDNDEFLEYQLFCFNGEPHSFLVRNDLETTGKCPFAVSYSLDWQRLYLRKEEEKFEFELPEPANRGKMIDYARRLSRPFPQVRVDFYEVNGKLFFGELTFSTHGNILSNYKEEALETWGKLLILPEPYNGPDKY